MGFQNLNNRLESLDRKKVPPLKFSNKRRWIIIAIVILILLLDIYFPARGVYASLQQINRGAKQLNESFKNNDLEGMKVNMRVMQNASGELNSSLNWIFWMRAIPILGGYYSDAKHFASAAALELSAASTLIDSLEPFKSELGLTGQPTPGTDRVAQAAKILNKIIPNIDQVEPQLKKAGQEVERIDINKYPEKIGGKDVRVKVEVAKNFISGIYLAVTQYRDALELAPSALGVPTAKNYMIIFQNDKEIRATGGFMTAYAFLKLDQGRVSSSQSDDIYRLDEKLQVICQKVICPLTPPEPLVRYLPEADGKPRKSWSLRDSNLSPDVATSMKDFEKMYAFLKGEQFDGIILIDTHVVEELIKITGPIEVFGTKYSADHDDRCNCPNVIYELENYAQIIERGEEDRKAILGVLMQQILARSLGAATDKLPEFINAGVKLANEKHMMFYLHDSSMQSALSKLNWVGEIKSFSGDYLHINDSNFAGRKSNLYVEQEVTYEIDTKNKKAKLSIKYSNPQQYDRWLNAINRDYLRIYVPKGSKLTNSKGSEVAVTTIEEELGKTVFEAFIQVRPQNSTNIIFEYDLPSDFTKEGKYPLLIQKQPGKRSFKYTVKVNGQTRAQFELNTDKELSL